MPQGWNTNGDPMLPGQSLAHLGQRQVRPVRNPLAQHHFQRRQERAPMATNRQAGSPSLHSKLPANLMHPAAAHLKAPGDIRRSLAPLQCVKHPLSQILRIRAHMRPLLWAEAA